MFKLPDWKDPKQYPQPGRVSNNRLAWEFVRRNPLYQADWIGYIALLRDGAKDDAELLRYVNAIAAGPDDSGRLWQEFAEGPKSNEMYSRLEQLPGAYVIEELGGGKSISRPIEAYLGRKWGLECIANPATEYHPTYQSFEDRKGFVMPTSHGVRQLEDDAAATRYGGRRGWLSDTRWLVISIDLEQPLEVIERVVLDGIRRERMLREEKGLIKPVQKRGKSPALMIEYLRILDARAVGANFGEIGARLHPKDQNEKPDNTRTKRMREAHIAACKMRDDEYRGLPILAEQGSRKRSPKI